MTDNPTRGLHEPGDSAARGCPYPDMAGDDPEMVVISRDSLMAMLDALSKPPAACSQDDSLRLIFAFAEAERACRREDDEDDEYDDKRDEEYENSPRGLAGFGKDEWI